MIGKIFYICRMDDKGLVHFQLQNGEIRVWQNGYLEGFLVSYNAPTMQH